VTIPGGKFAMGDTSADNTQPVHDVTVKTFQMSKSEVTVEQYAECVAKGKCTKANDTDGGSCNATQPNRDKLPVNCITWDQAHDYAAFKGARLPSEAEWEFAARSGGKKQKFPWGDTEATDDRVDNACHGQIRVCSKAKGNTAQGLCNMADNVGEWVQDTWHDTYAGAPTDGGAWEAPDETTRVARGGSSYHCSDSQVTYRVAARNGYDYVGVRLVKR
jgi:formylglycine-generating enzyme required for sulfatase activity